MSLGEVTAFDYGGGPLASVQEVNTAEGQETHFLLSPGSRWHPRLDHSYDDQGPSQKRRPRVTEGAPPPRKEAHHHPCFLEAVARLMGKMPFIAAPVSGLPSLISTSC